MGDQKAVFINVMDCENIEKLKDIMFGISKKYAEPNSQNSNTDCYIWQADTKYYTAKISIAILKVKSIVDEEFSNSVEAVLLYFDSSKEHNGLSKLESWLPFVKTWNPAIKLAVCDQFGNNAINRTSVLEWCLDNDCELIELSPDPEHYDEFEDYGVKRIKGALVAHMWPSMEIKSSKAASTKVPKTYDAGASKNALDDDAQKRIDSLLGKEDGFDDIVGDDNEEDNFEKLFSKLASMKDHSSSLPEEQRKKYAENMVKAFWTALGGDEEEIAGLSSDDESQINRDDATNAK